MPRLALISDTHLPERLAALPAGVFDALRGCDLLLHAGDVGALGVLDELAGLAPVIAVRGNDGGAESAAALPLDQLLVLGGRRILLWHGHFEDRGDELAWRHAAGWDDIFDRLAFRARSRGASILVTGHTHIPCTRERREVLLVNPGAIAPGNAFLQQTLRSVAILEVEEGALPRVQHIDVDTGETFDFRFEPDEAFGDVARRVQRTLLAPELRGMRRDLERFFGGDAGFREAWLAGAHRVWRGETSTMGAADARVALENGDVEAQAFARALADEDPTRIRDPRRARIG